MLKLKQFFQKHKAITGKTLLFMIGLFSSWDSTCLKVCEYPSKQDKNTLKNIKVLLYTHFYNISLNVLRSTFFNICNLPFAHFPNIGQIRVIVDQQKRARDFHFFKYFLNNLLLTVFVQNTLLKLVELLQ